jgi:hypothetical protein
MNNSKAWFDRLARAAATRTFPRQDAVRQDGGSATSHLEPAPSRGLTEIPSQTFTRRTGIKMAFGGIVAFLVADLPFPITTNAAPIDSEDCYAKCWNHWHDAFVNLVTHECLVSFAFCGFGAVLAFYYETEVACRDQCKPPPPPPPAPTTTAPSANGTCPSGYNSCGIFCLPPDYVCCPPSSTAGYCSAGEQCCPTACALIDSPCPN